VSPTSFRFLCLSFLFISCLSLCRLSLPFPSLITALRTVCPRGGSRLRARPSNTPAPTPPIHGYPTGSPNDEPDSIDSFLCRLYDCALNAHEQQLLRPSYQRHYSFQMFATSTMTGHRLLNNNSNDPITNATHTATAPTECRNFLPFPSPASLGSNSSKTSPHRLFVRQPSAGFDEMVRSPGFQTMKVMMDEISLFVSTQPEIQSRLRGELIDQAMRHDHNPLTFTRRRPTTHGAAN
jgi:hypothetical protein